MISTVTYNGDGATRIFPVAFEIKGEEYTVVYVGGVAVADRSLYDIINNAIVFNTAPVIGTNNVEIVVASTTTEIADLNAPPSTIQTVLDNMADINAIATTVIPNIDEILLADDKATIATTKALEANSSALLAAQYANSAGEGCAIVETIEELSLINTTVFNNTAIVKDLNRGGVFIYRPTGVANGGTIFDSSSTGKWYRQYDGAINVKWFGARDTLESGYDLFDSWDAINSAINMAYSNTIYIPVGRYKISKPIVLKSDAHQVLVGTEGGTVSGASWATISPLPTFIGETLLTNTTFATQQDPQRVTLKNLFFNGLNMVNVCVTLSELAGGHISDCSFINTRQYGIKVVGLATNFIHNIYINNCYVRMPNDQNLINPVLFPIYAAYYIEGSFHSISKCSSDGGRVGILLGAGDTDDVTARNIVSECHFEGWMEVGIKVHSLNQASQIVNNKCVSIYNATHFPDIVKQYGIELRSASGVSAGDNIVSGNIIANLAFSGQPLENTYIGIYAHSSSLNNTISNNSISRFWNGIVVDSPSNVMDSNIIYSAGNCYNVLSGVANISGGTVSAGAGSYTVSVSTYSKDNIIGNFISTTPMSFLNCYPYDKSILVLANQSVSQTLNNVVTTKLLFQNELIDSSNAFNPSTSIFTTQEEGYYHIDAMLDIGVSTSVLVLYLYKQGALVAELGRTYNGQTVGGSHTIFMQHGQDLTIEALNTGTNNTVIGANTRVNINFIGKR